MFNLSAVGTSTSIAKKNAEARSGDGVKPTEKESGGDLPVSNQPTGTCVGRAVVDTAGASDASNALEALGIQGSQTLTTRAVVKGGEQNPSATLLRQLKDAVRDDDVDKVTELAYKVELSNGFALHLAAELGRTACLGVLLDAGADPTMTDAYGFTPLYCAVQQGHKAFVERLVRALEPQDINAPNGPFKWTALHSAAYDGSIDILGILLQFGADPAITDDKGGTPLYAAVRRGHKACVEMLAKYSSLQSINATCGSAKWTALRDAATEGNDEIVSILLQAKADPAIKGRDGCTPLYVAVLRGHKACVEMLVKYSSRQSINARNGSGKSTALYLAASEGNDEIVSILLQAEADPAITDGHGFTPLYLAVHNGHTACVKRLVLDLSVQEINATSSQAKLTALHKAAFDGNDEILEILLRAKADPAIKSDDGSTPLYCAVQQGNKACVERLVRDLSDQDINATCGSAKWTALHKAAFDGNDEIVEVLLKANADPHSEDVNGFSPLAVAVELGHIGVVKQFVAYDSKVLQYRTAKHKQTLLHLAAKKGRNEIVTFLLEKSPELATVQDNPGALVGHKTPLSAAKIALNETNATIRRLEKNSPNSSELPSLYSHKQRLVATIATLEDFKKNAPKKPGVAARTLSAAKSAAKGLAEKATARSRRDGYALLDE